MTSASRATERPVPGVLRHLRHVPPFARTLDAIPEPRSAREARRDAGIALVYGIACHGLFGVAVLSMIAGMAFGLSEAVGAVPAPWSWAGNLLLLLQFPLGHSLFLSGVGRRLLARLAPGGRGPTLMTTTYALIASLQLLALFALWTPSGVIWWQADGIALWIVGLLYASSWLLLLKASWDAGAEVQSGLLGWLSLLRGVRPHYPPMPRVGLFRFVRQPIYVSFALTTWTVPTWTPDQLLLATIFTLYCVLGPLLKERRFARLFKDEWQRYRAETPYWLPLPWRSRP